MSFEQPQFENPLLSPEEKAEQGEARRGGLEGLRDYVKEMSLRLLKAGVSIRNRL